MNYQLFERVTRVNEFGDRVGLKHKENKTYREAMKSLVQEFNNFCNKVKEKYNQQVQDREKQLKIVGQNKHWQNSGYYSPYFWNKVIPIDAESTDITIWFLINNEGLRISIGTTNDFEKENSSQIINEVNSFFSSKLQAMDIEGFEFKLDSKYASYLYLKEDVDVIDFVEALKIMVPIYNEAITQFLNTQEDFESNLSEKAANLRLKNIILYGVPGVGKTHNIAKLIGLIEEGKGEKEIFDAIQKNEPYEKETLEDMQERIAFVTFHQSFGYEDFIEGFRPNEEGKIELVDGIFKSLSLRAKENLKKSFKSNGFDFEGFLNDYVTYVENKENFSLEEKLFLEVNKNSNGDFVSFRTKGRVKDQSLSKKIIQRDFENFLNGEIRQYQDIKPTYESKSSYHGNAPYYFKLFENMKSFMEQQGKENYQVGQEDRKNYYLIIDEINRGNISKIFGELITLIEEDKRDIYEVTLPYSKEKFSIPSNLYIIGTMNSTDKSIALIDIALRRRFTFLKMQPNDGLVPEFSRDLFKSLNDKIKEKLGNEYQIGHSYFMNITDKDMLDFVLEYKIKPLFEEYFYGDEAGLKEVLSVIEERGE